MHKSVIKLQQERTRKFITRLKSLFFEQRKELHPEYCKFDPHVDYKDCVTGNYQKIDKNAVWGQDWQRAWFHITGKVPHEWRGKHVVARINLGGEGLIFDNDGLPLNGLSVHTFWPTYEFWRDQIHISEKAKGGETIDWRIECTAGQIYGLYPLDDPRVSSQRTEPYHKAAIQYVELAVFRKDIWHLYLDCLVMDDLMRALPENSVRSKRILRALSRAIDQFSGDKTTTKAARKILQTELNKPATASDLNTTALGHAHLDTAWLWTVDETIRKCGRTFSAQLDLLERYNDYRFGASQAQLYAFTKSHYPQLYQKIRQKISQKKWEVQGAMWVEADCNIISGESMVRQFLYGKKYFKQEFGLDIDNLWLPDVFGYSAALPQIMRKSGVRYFLTQKLSWNQFNRFPHTTFIWRGIDGSEVLTHFPPEDNYNSNLLPSVLIKARENFSENDRLDEFMTLFGIGDGGSGPTEEMIESGLRQYNLEGAPKVQFKFASDFFNKLEQSAHVLPTWSGELYLELHRGTLTTQAIIKKENRELELKLRQTEILFSMLPYAAYPAEELEALWKTLLLNQFHDIIPGSSVAAVYRDTLAHYKDIRKKLTDLQGKAFETLCTRQNDALTLFNALSVPFSRPIELPDDWVNYVPVDDNNQEIPVQYEDNHPVIHLEIPPLQARTIYRKKSRQPAAIFSENKDFVLENDHILYRFNEQGQLDSIFDKETGREVLAENGSGNVLSYYEDRPVNWDAWDIDIYYENQLLEHAQLTDRQWIADGEVRQGISQKLTVGHSKITQQIFLDKQSKQLDFRTEVDWQENHKMLRVSFSVDVHSDMASYEIQFGHVRRATHRNTSWDLARFEVVGHRYADLSDHEYGVALLNDCKYGYKIHENVIDLNLLRAPGMPDPTADRGLHRFTYSLLPHAGNLINSPVLNQALQLNQPPKIISEYAGSNLNIPFQLNTYRVVLDTIKKAENEDAWILRLYEPFGLRTSAELQISDQYHLANETDLIEKDQTLLAIMAPEHKIDTSRTKRSIKLDFKPFEIKTICIK